MPDAVPDSSDDLLPFAVKHLAAKLRVQNLHFRSCIVAGPLAEDLLSDRYLGWKAGVQDIAETDASEVVGSGELRGGRYEL